ncbi:MAG TPA: hypothetical protein VGE88_07190 [Lysobacter sp.]
MLAVVGHGVGGTAGAGGNVRFRPEADVRGFDMWPFGRSAQLLRLLGNLAFYNDKGIAYSRHDAARVETGREQALADMRALVEKIGPEALPPEFMQALATGEVATDSTGRYVDALKRHFKGGRS